MSLSKLTKGFRSQDAAIRYAQSLENRHDVMGHDVMVRMVSKRWYMVAVDLDIYYTSGFNVYSNN